MLEINREHEPAGRFNNKPFCEGKGGYSRVTLIVVDGMAPDAATSPYTSNSGNASRSAYTHMYKIHWTKIRVSWHTLNSKWWWMPHQCHQHTPFIYVKQKKITAATSKRYAPRISTSTLVMPLKRVTRCT